MTVNNNPLKQYFRRPAVYIKLPSEGKGYKPGVINLTETGELPVYPMTAIDEITSKTPDALYNGTAVTELIKSCIPDIKDPWSINSNDLDAILISIKAASGGNNLEIETTCPKCENVDNYGLNLVAILSEIKPGDYDKTLRLNDLEIKFRPLIFKEMNQASMGQFEIQKMFTKMEAAKDDKERTEISQNALKAVTELTMEILSQTIEYIQTPSSRVEDKNFILDFLKNCDRGMYIKIRDYNAELKTGSELKPLNIKCEKCSNEYKQAFTLNPSDFFG